MGGIATGGQLDRFEERLRRIHGGTGAASPATATAEVPPSVRVSRTCGLPVWADLALVPVAALVGGLSLLAGRIAAFHLLSAPALVPDGWRGVAEQWVDLGLALTVLVALGWCFSLTAGLRRTALVLGFAAMMVAEPLLMSRLPVLSSALTSAEHVAAVSASETHVAETLARLRGLTL